MSGTAWAAANVGSEQVIDNSLRSVDLRTNAAVRSADVVDDTVTGGGLQSSDIASNVLTGADINESTLGTVEDADRLDYLDSSAFVRKCQMGSVHGFVKVNGNMGIPTEFTTTGTSVAYNCGGSAPLVHRCGNYTGFFVLCFPNNPSIAGLGNAVWMNETSDQDNIVTWQSATDGECPGGKVFWVLVSDNDGSNENAPFFFAAF